MGVTGLWKLIESSGKPIPLETLEGKVLAIDISIWLHQVVKGYQDGKGSNVPNAHVLGLFNRICKLLYFRIKPVFVFDGAAPMLKKQTIAKRAQSKSKIQSDAERLEQLLLETLAKEKIVIQALGDPEKILLSPSKGIKPKPPKETEKDELFMLPPINEEEKLKTEILDDEEDDLCPKQSYDFNIHKIDVTSSHFRSLPADMRHDILTDLKETRKQNSWGRIRELPVESNDFSSYQMRRLLKRRQVQVSLEDAEKEMGGKTWSLTELESLMKEDGVLNIAENHAQKIASNENARFLLVRDIAKSMDVAKKSEEISKNCPQATTLVKDEGDLDDAEDLDLQRAIQLSLENQEEDEENENEGARNLNLKQRKKFASSIQDHGLVRGFMMEYAEMNDDDIKDLLESTQQENETEEDAFKSKFPLLDDYILNGTQKNDEKSAILLSESESEEEVVEDKKIEILVKTQYKPENDIFADIFESKTDENAAPDVEIASISSDDTLPYDVEEIHEKNSESGFVSDECKTESSHENLVEKLQENAKTPNEPISVENSNSDENSLQKEVPVNSENEKFWSGFKKPTETSSNEDLLLKKSESEKFLEEFRRKMEAKKSQKTPEKAKVEEKIDEKSPPKFEKDEIFEIVEQSPAKIENKIEIQESPVKFEPQPCCSKSLQSPPKVKNVLEEAAEILKKGKTESELLEMKENLRDQQATLAKEVNKLDRIGTSITKSMSQDCKELLKLFGIPYIESPMEAEAQCAFLNIIGLTDGTITDDSDILLFGGKTIYKNFFVQKKIVMEFKLENVEEKFHLDRKKLIQLAMLVGSDYTLGVNGIGAVTALEILAAFPSTEEAEGTNQYQSLVSSLRKFREWWNGGKQTGTGGKTALKSKLKNIELSEGFPNIEIARAYLEPTIDSSAEPFSWGNLDKETLIDYAKTKLGWTRIKTEEILDPVMKKLNEKKQATIKDYFKSQISKKFVDNTTLSKRVQKALGRMEGVEDEEKVEKPKKTRKRKTEKQTKSEDVEVLISSDDEEPKEKKFSPIKSEEPQKPSTSNEKSKKVSKKSEEPESLSQKLFKEKKTRKAPAKRKPKLEEVGEEIEEKPRKIKIPDSNPKIPQREKDKVESEIAKQKAIEVFKKKSASKKKNF